MLQASSERPHHLERTASCSRAVTESTAVVEHIKDISPTVKFLSLRVQDKRLNFFAGQWVDFVIPGVDTVGGYSMCSAPHKLHEYGLLDLAVKYSRHPPAYWVHTKCCVGSKVKLRVGGDFHYAPPDGASCHTLLLLAGGVGINPLYSILSRVTHLCHISGCDVRASLLYSAKSPEELLFKEEIEELTTASGLHSQFFITSQDGLEDGYSSGRISSSVLGEELRRLEMGGQKVTTYICGPGPMIDSMEKLLLQLGQNQSQILSEKWW